MAKQQPDDSGWDIGNVLPLAQRRIPYANALQPQLAVPGILRDPISSLGQMLTVPGQALRGELGQQPEGMMEPALRFAEGMMTAGAGAPAPRGSMRIFGGLKSKALDRGAMTKARELEAKGTPSPDVWSQTGMFRGPDNKWRHEISDEGASWKGVARQLNNQPSGMVASSFGNRPIGGMSTIELEGEHKLGDILEHPKLFEAYPHLKDLTVGKDTSGNLGGYGGGQIGLGGGQDRQSSMRTLMHEVQHAVQDHEGHAFGGTPQEFMPDIIRKKHSISGMEMLAMQEEARAKGGAPLFIESALQKQQTGVPLLKQEQKAADWLGQNPDIASRYQETMNRHNELSQQYAKAWEEGHKQYQALGGETESRNVEERLRTGDWRSFPGHSQDVPFEDQRVRFPSGETFGEAASHSLEPIEHDPFVQTAAGHQISAVEHDPFASNPEQLPMKGGVPFRPEGWQPPQQIAPAAPLGAGESALDVMKNKAKQLEDQKGGALGGISDASTLDASKQELHLGEADAALAQKMVSGQWRGLPARLPDWIKTKADLESYHAQEVQQFVEQGGT